MATNANTRFGLKPVQMLSGANWSGKTRLAYVSANYATALYAGDPVDIDSTNSEKEAGIKHLSVIKAAVGGPFLGVIVGVLQEMSATPMFTSTGVGVPNLYKNYLPASTGGYVLITMDMGDIIYEIQSDIYAVPSLNWIGWNANMVFTNAGSTVTGLSGVELDTGTATAPATTNTLALHIIGAVDRPDNDMTLLYAKFLVTNNNPRLANQTAGIGS